MTGVRGVISVAHNSPEGVPHGHSYAVRVWFRHGSDARHLKQHLDLELEKLCHTFLPDELRSGERLAEYFAERLPGAVRVDVDRPLEGFFAMWEADDLHR